MMFTGFNAPIDAQALGDLIDDIGELPVTMAMGDNRPGLEHAARFMHTVLAEIYDLAYDLATHKDGSPAADVLALIGIKAAVALRASALEGLMP